MSFRNKTPEEQAVYNLVHDWLMDQVVLVNTPHVSREVSLGTMWKKECQDGYRFETSIYELADHILCELADIKIAQGDMG